MLATPNSLAYVPSEVSDRVPSMLLGRDDRNNLHGARLAHENPTALDVLKDVYDQLQSAETARLRPLFDSLLSRTRRGQRPAPPRFSHGRQYPDLEPKLAVIFNTTLQCECLERSTPLGALQDLLSKEAS